MKIYLVRHSVPDEAPEGDEFADDPSLSDEGKDIAASLAKWMIDKEEVPNSIYASPSARTQETADILRKAFTDAGFVLPKVKEDATVGPHMSIRGLVKQMADDDSVTKPMIVSHHESIGNGLRVLDRPDHPDPMAQGELRIMKVKRKDASWSEHRRVVPSKLGGADHY